MSNIYCPISIGEIIDKITILQLKQQFIKDKTKLVDISYELDLLNPLVESYIKKYNSHFKYLKWVNKEIWEQNELRTKINDKEIVKNMIVDIMIDNDARFRLKNRLNYLLDSAVKEHKSYNNKICILLIDDVKIDMTGLINYLSIHNDELNIIVKNLEQKYIINHLKLDNSLNIFTIKSDFNRLYDILIKENKNENIKIYYIKESSNYYENCNVPNKCKYELI